MIIVAEISHLLVERMSPSAIKSILDLNQLALNMFNNSNYPQVNSRNLNINSRHSHREAPLRRSIHHLMLVLVVLSHMVKRSSTRILICIRIVSIFSQCFHSNRIICRRMATRFLNTYSLLPYIQDLLCIHHSSVLRTCHL